MTLFFVTAYLVGLRTGELGTGYRTRPVSYKAGPRSAQGQLRPSPQHDPSAVKAAIVVARLDIGG